MSSFMTLKINYTTLVVMFTFIGNIISKYMQSCELSTSSNSVNESNRRIAWDPQVSTAEEFHFSFCRRRCRQGEVVGDNNAAGNHSLVQCFDCQCQMPACEIYGICCPDVEEFNNSSTSGSLYNELNVTYSKLNRSTNTLASSTNLPVVFCDAYLSHSQSFLVIRSCASRNDSDTVRFCEQDVPDHEMTYEVFARAVDISTRVVYYNIYCARCNGVSKYSQWRIVLKCKSYMSLYTIEDMDILLRQARQDKDVCKVTQEPQAGITPLECVTFNNRPYESIIDSCNTSHPDQLNDEAVARACTELKSLKYRIADKLTSLYYRNIFCANCHMKLNPTVPRHRSCFDQRFGKQPNVFTLIMNPLSENHVDESDRSMPSRCSNTEWTAPNGQCLVLHCSPGKRLENGNCTTVFTDIKVLRYRMRSWLVPCDNLTFQGKMSDFKLMTSIENEVKELLSRISSNYAVLVGVKTRYPRDSKLLYNVSLSFTTWIDLKIIASSDLTRDEFEKSLINYFLRDCIVIKDSENDSESISARTFLMLLDLGNENICSLDQNNPFYNISCNHLEEMIINNNLLGDIGNSYQFLKVTATLTCSYLKFRQTQYSFHFDQSDLPPRVTVTIVLGGMELNFTEIEDINRMALDRDDVLIVCHDVIDAKLKEIKLSKQITRALQAFDPSSVAQYVVAITSVAVSVVCLTLTIVTYLRFPTLRTVPGINNIFLSLSLLLAQIFLMTSYHLSGPGLLCTTVGILTHFLWLWMFSWTFICSLHMFRVFSSKTANASVSPYSSRKHLLKTVLLSLLSPTVIVATVIVTTKLSFNSIVYGQSTCYVDSPIIIGSALVAPLVVIVSCNVTFFVITVINIRKVRVLLTNRTDEYQNLYVYVKLSSLTGVFWIFGIAAELADNDILRIISIVFNGLQGVFLFVSYTCNKRVLHLYATRNKLNSKMLNPRLYTEKTDTE